MSPAEPDRSVLDRAALRRAFNRAAGGYDAVASLQQRARAELLQRLDFFDLEPQRVLDLGAGTCQSTPALARRYPQAKLLAVDLAEGMLAQAPRSGWRRPRFGRVCADAYALPLRPHCFDLVYCNLMLQWCDRPSAVLTELSRVLRPGGLLLFSSFATATLEELRSAWATVDERPHVHEFLGLSQVAEALLRSGFVEPVIDVERQTRHYPDVRALMHELKRMGAQNAAHTRPRGLSGRARIEAVCAAYEPRRVAAGLPATWELLFGAAFAAAVPPPPSPAGEYAVPIGSIARFRPT